MIILGIYIISERVGTMRAGIREQYRNVSAEYNYLVTAARLSSDFAFQFVMLLLAFLMEKELVLKSVSCLKIHSSLLLMSRVLK